MRRRSELVVDEVVVDDDVSIAKVVVYCSVTSLNNFQSFDTHCRDVQVGGTLPVERQKERCDQSYFGVLLTVDKRQVGSLQYLRRCFDRRETAVQMRHPPPPRVSDLLPEHPHTVTV